MHCPPLCEPECCQSVRARDRHQIDLIVNPRSDAAFAKIVRLLLLLLPVLCVVKNRTASLSHILRCLFSDAISFSFLFCHHGLVSESFESVPTESSGCFKPVFIHPRANPVHFAADSNSHSSPLHSTARTARTSFDRQISPSLPLSLPLSHRVCQ
ncbi:hypothetical protein MPTK1_2g24080 [Marchantia polymorpha subsp. ruderalis]|uniref:Uncharacterized protein n=1 Tax=Marchantia polymorpha TaxID=3197 RepID=A0A2R6WPD4_MARPO|nr:hypothetical protein MARPO_0069s0057 [Marchantia polymorpha]BBN03512.1 hypothetical protein Mp_2g24080 [Marchantia polymorpha subsp. ruderalis]|eukprot:PTQ35718.1 hypothetical protein MARPO_0069s0057 [Marchantia polymorpha]